MDVTELVERLRNRARSVPRGTNEPQMCRDHNEAADALEAQAAEIAALHGALSSIARNTCCDRCQEAALVARAVLAGKEPTT